MAFVQVHCKAYIKYSALHRFEIGRILLIEATGQRLNSGGQASMARNSTLTSFTNMKINKTSPDLSEGFEYHNVIVYAAEISLFQRP